MLTWTVVDVLVAEVIGNWLPLEEDQEEKVNGPLAEALIVTIDPESNQPSLVGLTMELE